MQPQSNLGIELIRLRRNFHLRLARKRQLNTDAREIDKIAQHMDDKTIQDYLEKPFEFRRWLRFFR